jgi:hypothetical protein
LRKILISGDEIINTENGTYKFRSAKITDTHPHAYLTARGILGRIQQYRHGKNINTY